MSTDWDLPPDRRNRALPEARLFTEYDCDRQRLAKLPGRPTAGESGWGRDGRVR
jgi:hypothetical protein